MGFFSKLNPFKKKDDFDDLGKDLGLGNDFGKGFGKDLGMNDMNADAGPSPDLGMGLDMPAGGPGQQHGHVLIQHLGHDRGCRDHDLARLEAGLVDRGSRPDYAAVDVSLQQEGEAGLSHGAGQARRYQR